MNKLRIHITQPDIVWENPDENKKKYEELLAKLTSGDEDLVLFPELYLTGFSMNSSRLGENMNGPGVSWMKQMALKHSKIIAGSHIIKDRDKCYNRFLFVFPDGNIDFYDKRHLFRMGDEHEHYSRGNTRKVMNIANWRILPVICYDLRFPVWIRNRNDYDVMLCIANWPAVRQQVWNNLLVSRAIENMSYVVGVNRIGTDGRNIKYEGGSQAIDPKGEIILKSETSEGIFSIELDNCPLQRFRKSFPVHLDADDFTLQ